MCLTGGHETRREVYLGGQYLGDSRLHDDPELPPTLLCMTIPAITPRTPAAMYLPVLSSCWTITVGVSVLTGEDSGVDAVCEYPDASAISACRCSEVTALGS